MAKPGAASPRRIVIAIDGPAGSGKSTLAKLLAERYQYTNIETGAMYRALALKAME
ncbi:MAG TPA: (d)CMP kinase, partial [Candidatus Limnocylindrales bacterium]|nr:(d)CMP kinase [Candidatus Limnocylindrales bacterium]